jgi:glutamate-1-semialdehyde 2,1-aminomutase
MNSKLSDELFKLANEHMVGGVNSPVRAFKAVGSNPKFIVRAKDSKIYDADGNEYIDYVGTWGPAILGHAHPKVLNAIYEAMKSGISFGASCPKEIDLAIKVKNAYPAIEKVRFTNSGTEACMSAIRLARGYTQKDKIIKFDGCYHGHADYLLVKAGSGAQTLGSPDSKGVPEDFAKHTLIAKYNDLDSVKKLFQEHNDIAAIIIEPIVGNMGCIPPNEGFLKELKNLAHENNSLLILDEVMTGFRVSFGGACELYDIKPDLVCLGKIIGGGLPVGAFGGDAKIMDHLAPLGSVYQAGTLSGNPMAMAAGSATLAELEDRRAYEKLELKGKIIESGLHDLRNKFKLDLQINRVGSMFSMFFIKEEVKNADDARNASKEKFNQVFHSLLENGVYLAPSCFEAGFISLAHHEIDLEDTLGAFEKAFSGL